MAISSKFVFAPVTVQPFFDEGSRSFVVGGKHYPGKQVVDHSRKESWYETDLGDGPGQTPVVLSSREGIRLYHGLELVGAAGDLYYQIGLDSRYVVKDKATAGGNPDARLYIQDDMEQARETNKKADLIRRALLALVNLPGNDDKYDLAWALKQPVRKMSQEIIDSSLNAVALSTPEVLLAILESRNFKVISFLEKLHGYGVVTKKGEQWWFGEEMLGADRAQAIAFMTDKKNANMRDQLIAQLDTKTNGVMKTSKVDESGSVDFGDELPEDQPEKLLVNPTLKKK